MRLVDLIDVVHITNRLTVDVVCAGGKVKQLGDYSAASIPDDLLVAHVLRVAAEGEERLYVKLYMWRLEWNGCSSDSRANSGSGACGPPNRP